MILSLHALSVSSDLLFLQSEKKKKKEKTEYLECKKG